MLGGWEQVYWLSFGGNASEISSMPAERFEPYRVVGGHAPATAFHHLPDPKVFASVIREPVSRAVSLYEYIVRGGDETHPLRSELQELGLQRSITESDDFRRSISNTQCAMIGGEATFTAARKNMHEFSWIVATPGNAQTVVDKAAEILDVAPSVLRPENVGRTGYYDRLATPEIIEEIADLNREDRLLYEYVERRERPGLRARLDQAVSDLRRWANGRTS